ncbi:hypothetical protein FQZ97_1139510 [compost metagenome]
MWMSNSLSPVACWICESRRLTEGCVVCSRAAAAVVVPVCITARKASIWRKFNGRDMRGLLGCTAESMAYLFCIACE